MTLIFSFIYGFKSLIYSILNSVFLPKFTHVLEPWEIIQYFISYQISPIIIFSLCGFIFTFERYNSISLNNNWFYPDIQKHTNAK